MYNFERNKNGDWGKKETGGLIRFIVQFSLWKVGVIGVNIHGTIQTWKRCSYFPFEFYSWPSFNPEKRIVKPAYGSKQNGDSKLHSDLAARQLGKPVPRSYFRHPFLSLSRKGDSLFRSFDLRPFFRPIVSIIRRVCELFSWMEKRNDDIY